MKKIISILISAAILCSFSVAAFAEDSQVLTMKMNNEGRSVFYEDGTRVTYAIWEDVMTEFHRLRNGNGVNWDLFEYEEMTFELDGEGNVKALTQYIIGNNGEKVVTDDPNVAFIDSPAKIHASGAGETQVRYFDAEGNEQAVSNIKVSGTSFRNYQLINACSKCQEDQGSVHHLMSCGHFSCDVGSEGHGDAPCGTFGHYNCDGDVHTVCTNCRNGVCNGKEHGEGICPHVHTPVHFAWDRQPTCSTNGIERIVCAGCGAGAIVEVPPCDHVYTVANYCKFCGRSMHQIMLCG